MSKEKDKALIKETGEVKSVENHWTVKHLTMSFTYQLSDSDIEDVKQMTLVHDSDPKEEGEYYTLDNGKMYHEKDVIVGLDEIRDHKLKDII